MNLKLIVGTAGVLMAGLLLPACGGSDSPPAAAAPPMQIKAESPAGVLALARTSSETTDPLTVAADAIAVASLNDETSDPIPVS